VRHCSDTLYASLRDHLKDKGVRKKIIDLLSENWLVRVLAGLRPDQCLAVQKYAEIIADACYSTELFKQPHELNRLKWEFIFAYLAKSGNSLFQKSDFIQHFTTFLADKTLENDLSSFTKILCENLTADVRASTRAAHLTVISELGRMAEINSLPWREGEIYPHTSKDALKSEPAETLKMKHPGGVWDAAEETLEEVVVRNAGMVMAAPYLPQLWNMLGLVEKEIFKNNRAAERAVHLLQFMTDKRIESPEYELVLNKILCGVKSSEPITGRIDITEKEQQAVEGLIQGMITNWKGIGQTSIEGFRESFLQRRGRLKLKDDAWHLKVEQRAFDMLLDSIPWGFATIKHPWMERVVYVKWR
jgi:hypothetical protein